MNHHLADLGWVDFDLDIPPIPDRLLSPFCQNLIGPRGIEQSEIAKIKIIVVHSVCRIE